MERREVCKLQPPRAGHRPSQRALVLSSGHSEGALPPPTSSQHFTPDAVAPTLPNTQGNHQVANLPFLTRMLALGRLSLCQPRAIYAHVKKRVLESEPQYFPSKLLSKVHGWLLRKCKPRITAQRSVESTENWKQGPEQESGIADNSRKAAKSTSWSTNEKVNKMRPLQALQNPVQL